MDNVTVLFPGGFKPITGAHMQLAERYADNPQVSQVIMLVGPKERDGITRSDSQQIFELLNTNSKIKFQSTDFNSPIMAAYEYLFSLPASESGTYALAASNKDNDYVRVKDFVGNVDKYKITGDRSGRKIPQGVDAVELMVTVDPLTTTDGEPISASRTRAALSDYDTFKQSYPQYKDAIVKNIFQILRGTQETFLSKEWWLSQLQEDIDAVTEGYMDPKTAEKHRKKIEKLKKFLKDNPGKEFVYDFGDYEKTTFGVKLTESKLHENYITRAELAEIEPVIDNFFRKYGIDVDFQGKFTHFIDRLNDPRNEGTITLDDLENLFSDLANEYGEEIVSQLREKRPTAVASDYQFDVPLHMPFQLRFDPSLGQIKLSPRTIKAQRKRWQSNNPQDKIYTIESVNDPDNNDIETEYTRDYLSSHSVIIDRIASAFHENVVSKLGEGYFGYAYKLASGRVMKITDNKSEINNAWRIHRRPKHPHIVGYYDVRRLGDSDWYALIMDYVTPFNYDEKSTWGTLYQDFVDYNRSDERFDRLIDNAYRPGPAQDFWKRVLSQRKSFLNALKKFKLNPYEAHANNMGWDEAGRLTHFDTQVAYDLSTADWTEDNYNRVKTVLQKRQISEGMITEGGLGGHMNHPYDTHGLTFNDMKEIISRALDGRLDMEQAVTEKTDGQNIFVTYKDGQVKFARGTRERVNPLSVAELQEKFGGRGAISDAFGEAGTDLNAALSKLGQERLNEIFKNGRIFANMEIIYPATRNVISYEDAYLQFHNLTEFDEKGNVVMTDMPGGAELQKAIQSANAHLQKTFQIIPPRQLKIGRVDNFEDYQDALHNEVDQLKNRFGLDETDLVSEYHKAWWKDVIETKAQELGYNIPENVTKLLVNRWALADKSTRITALVKQIDNEDFANWVNEFDKKDFKKYQKQNIEPFESIFLKLGAMVLKNASDFLALNPSKAVQQIRQDMADSIKALRQTNDPKQLELLSTQLGRIQRLGGFEAIVPIEGLVFVYGGNTYKLTGAFAPINQLVGILKYNR